MDFLNYSEKLGVGFNDDLKFRYFKTKLFNIFDVFCDDFSLGGIDSLEYYSFCNLTGTKQDTHLNTIYDSEKRMRHCITVLEHHTSCMTDFLPYCMAFINSLKTERNGIQVRLQYVNVIKRMLEESHIPYELVEDNNEYFIFPKGAPEFDSALVSEPFDWLKDYPIAHRTYVFALKQYADGIYIRDVADNLRKTLEAFLQEFLGNNKNLESNKSDICRYLGEQDVDPGIAGLFHPLINSYKNINDRIAKHNDAVDEKLLEFLLYQTGVLIRLVLTVKHSEVEKVSNTN